MPVNRIKLIFEDRYFGFENWNSWKLCRLLMLTSCNIISGRNPADQFQKYDQAFAPIQEYNRVWQWIRPPKSTTGQPEDKSLFSVVYSWKEKRNKKRNNARNIMIKNRIFTWIFLSTTIFFTVLPFLFLLGHSLLVLFTSFQ